jgi:predicted O-methyltransferase YrrM
MINDFFPMREGDDKIGLLDLINYISTITNTKDLTIIEIGSYIGESTMVFGDNFKNVISIDPFIEYDDVIKY